jgi:hypothetical protein
MNEELQDAPPKDTIVTDVLGAPAAFIAGMI